MVLQQDHDQSWHEDPLWLGDGHRLYKIDLRGQLRSYKAILSLNPSLAERVELKSKNVPRPWKQRTGRWRIRPLRSFEVVLKVSLFPIGLNQQNRQNVCMYNGKGRNQGRKQNKMQGGLAHLTSEDVRGRGWGQNGQTENQKGVWAKTR